jgi:PAS domain S-box-containing protein
MDEKVEILLFEDNPGDTALIEEMLEEFADFPYELKNVETLNEGLSLLEEFSFDVIITDLRLPDSDGIDTFLDIHARNSRIPTIILTASNDEKIVIDAVKKGAQDYLIKGQADGRLLKRSIQYSIERKKAETKIQILANIMESSNDAIITGSLDGIVTSWNKGAEQIYGYSAEETLGQNASILEPEHLKGDIKRFNERIKRGEKVKNYETVRLRKDGTQINVSVTLSPVFDIHGKLTAISSIARDITESRRAEEKLRESEEKYRNIIETTNEGIVVIDADLRIIYINKNLTDKGGYSQEEVIGRPWWDFTDEEGKAVAKLHMDKRREGIDETYELKLIRKDGSPFWVLVSSKSLLDKDDKFAGSLSMLTDITERKKAEEKIKSLATVVESSDDAIITESLDGIITSWNNGAEQVYGYSAEEVLGKNISILEPDNLKGEIKHLADEIKHGKKIKHYETSRLKKDDTTINVSVSLSPIFDQSRKLVALSSIARDTTEKKIAEKLLQEKQIAEVANRAKSEFLANISHELRTPLNSIIGFSDMLYEQMYGELNQKQLRSVGNISKSGKHLLNLINNILDISKIEAGKMELGYKNFELASKLNMIRNILFPVADQKNIKIEIDVDNKLVSICADEDKFVQVMYNLVDNAIKFSYENSLVKIGARKKGDLVEIMIIDTGIGIKVEDQNKLFKPFSQSDSFSFRKSQGTGLGLSLVKQIVHLHGGYIWFRSNPSEGSTFAFAIPINNNKGNSVSSSI